MFSNKASRVFGVIALFAFGTACKAPQDPVTWKDSDPQAKARAAIVNQLTNLLEAKLLAFDEDEQLFIPASRQEARYLGLDRSPLDLMFNVGRTAALCQSYASLTGSGGYIQSRREELADDLTIILESLAGNYDESLEDQPDDWELNAKRPTISPAAQQARVLNELDRARLLSTVFAVRLLEKVEKETPGELYRDLPTYSQLIEDVETFGNELIKQNPQTDLDLFNDAILGKQKKLVESALALIQEFHSTHLGDGAKLSYFLTVYGDEEFAKLESLTALMNKTRALASVNDKKFERMGWITDPMIITDRVRLMNEYLPDYFEGLDLTAARLQSEVAPIVAISNKHDRAAEFCAVATEKYDTLASTLGEKATSVPENISEERSRKVDHLVDLGNFELADAAAGSGTTAAQ